MKRPEHTCEFKRIYFTIIIVLLLLCIKMKRKHLTKTFIMISNWKNLWSSKKYFSNIRPANTKHLYNDGPTSPTLVHHYTNVWCLLGELSRFQSHVFCQWLLNPESSIIPTWDALDTLWEASIHCGRFSSLSNGSYGSRPQFSRMSSSKRLVEKLIPLPCRLASGQRIAGDVWLLCRMGTINVI